MIGDNGEDHQALVDEGKARIAWVGQHSPVLTGSVRDRLNDGSLKGAKIAVVVHLEAKTAFLASILADAGAEVVAAGSNPKTTDGAVVAALRDKGITVVSEPDGDFVSWEKELIAAANLEPEYIIDDGAELTMRVQKNRPDVFANLKGMSEETTTGTARLKAMEEAGKLPFPALTANDARCKHLFDNRFGTGQTTIQAILRLTNKRIAGAHVAIIGYGYVGRGIAEYASAMGAQVRVVEIDPVRALEAHMDGYRVGSAEKILPGAQFVITATGGMRAIGKPEFNVLNNGAILANAGHHDLEIDVDTLGDIASQKREMRNGITAYTIGDRDLYVLSGGALVNIAGGNGHPVEIMDLTFSVQALGAHYLVNTPMKPGVHVLPKEIDDSIAAAKLASMGIELDELRAEQNDDHLDTVTGASI